MRAWETRFKYPRQNFSHRLPVSELLSRRGDLIGRGSDGPRLVRNISSIPFSFSPAMLLLLLLSVDPIGNFGLCWRILGASLVNMRNGEDVRLENYRSLQRINRSLSACCHGGRPQLILLKPEISCRLDMERIMR